MPVFEYQARTMQGAKVNGTLEAVSSEAVISALREKGYFPEKIKPYKAAVNINFGNFKKITVKDIAIFCNQFAFIMSAGVGLLKSIEILKTQTENQKLRDSLGEVYGDVQRGHTLSESMGKHKHFPQMLVDMIGVGESSGTLDKILFRMAAYYDSDYRTRQKIKQALTYPMVVGIFAILVVTGLVTYVVPIFADMLKQFGGGQLPLPTQIVMAISNTIRFHWYFILAGILAAVFLIRAYVKSDSGRIFVDATKLKIPVAGKIYKKILTARFARTFGTLMGSGLPLLDSMRICSDVIGNVVVNGILDATKDDIKRGRGIGETLGEKKFFPVMLTQMIKIGEESGTLDTILEKTASFYDNEVEVVTSQLATIIEPFVIIFLAFIVGFIVLSIILPIFSIYNAVG